MANDNGGPCQHPNKIVFKDNDGNPTEVYCADCGARLG